MHENDTEFIIVAGLLKWISNIFKETLERKSESGERKWKNKSKKTREKRERITELLNDTAAHRQPSIRIEMPINVTGDESTFTLQSPRVSSNTLNDTT